MTRPIDVTKPVTQEDADYLAARGDARAGLAVVEESEQESKTKAPAKSK